MIITVHLPPTNEFSTKAENSYRVELEGRKRAFRVLSVEHYTLLDAISVALTHREVTSIKLVTYNGAECGLLEYRVIRQLSKDGEL